MQYFTKCRKWIHLPKQHAPRVLDVLFDLDQESDGLAAIQQAVIVGERKVHHLFVISNGFKRTAREGQHTGRISTLPFTATGLSLIAWSPRTARRC